VAERPDPLPTTVPVLIAGGGPVGLTLAALLAAQGVRCLVIEADASYCEGSRAICVSRRSQEILGWVGADRALVEKGLSWTGGRSYFRDCEVLHFLMQSNPTERFAPMVNIQQFYIEEMAHRAASAPEAAADIRWSTRVVDFQPCAGGVQVSVEGPNAVRQVVHADWLIACDGGRSTVRERSGLALEGVQYEGRYVIVDIRQATKRPVERLAWFDPPSNPGSTLLMHRQPDNVWRIDYQIADDEDPVEAVKPENVLPRVENHLRMIGETAPWEPLWISIYNAKCLTLNDYRHGRVLFAGDAAHLVPIFGVRGLNSGLDDVGNLAWKLALVTRGRADPGLIDSYSSERVHAARQNIAYGAKSTEFMAPPHYGFRLMREAALRLASESDVVRSLINPRQSTPIDYPDSPLNHPVDASEPSPRPGEIAPEAMLADGHMTEHFGHDFVALHFSDEPFSSASAERCHDGGPGLRVWRVSRDAGAQSGVLHDVAGEAWQRYRARAGTLVLVRPDGYVQGRWPRFDAQALGDALRPFGLTLPLKQGDGLHGR
jgi:3-(3-hydroxy-phenyl)propionate hydroxylase